MAYRWKVPEFNAGFVDPDGVRSTMMRKAYIDRAANEMNGYATSWPEDIRQIPIQSQSASNSMLGYQPNGAGGFVNDRSNNALWEDYRTQVGQERRELAEAEIREMAEAEMNRQNTLNRITELQSELAQIDAQIAEIEKTMPKGVSDAEWEIAAKRAEIGDNSAYDNLVSRGYNQMATARSVEDNIKNELYNAEKLTWGLNVKSDEEKEMAANQIDVSLRKAEDMAAKNGTKLPDGYYRLKTALDKYREEKKKTEPLSGGVQNSRVYENTLYTKAKNGTLHDADIKAAEKYLADNPGSEDASRITTFIDKFRNLTVEAKERDKVNKEKADEIYKKLSSASKDDAKKIWTELSKKEERIFKKYYNVGIDASGNLSFTRK